jgi:hypothetical protein
MFLQISVSGTGFISAEQAGHSDPAFTGLHISAAKNGLTDRDIQAPHRNSSAFDSISKLKYYPHRKKHILDKHYFIYLPEYCNYLFNNIKTLSQFIHNIKNNIVIWQKNQGLPLFDNSQDQAFY